MKNIIQSIFIASHILLITSANAQQFGVKSQYNYTQKTQLREYKNTNLFGYWCTPSKDYNPQWIYFKYRRNQVDFSFNTFSKFISETSKSLIPPNETFGERFNIKEFNLKYNYYFTQNSIQPFTFITANYQIQNNKFIQNYYSKNVNEYINNYNAVIGAIFRADLGVGVLFQKNNFGFYLQMAAPLFTSGKIETFYHKRGEYVYDEKSGNSTYIDTEVYEENVINKPFILKPKYLKLQSSFLQAGFQYQLYSLKKDEPIKVKSSDKILAVNIGATLSGINYASAGFTVNLSINNNYQIAYFYGRYNKFELNYFPDLFKQECLVVSKVYHRNNFRFAAGLGGQIIQGKFASFLPLLYADAGFMLDQNTRAGIIFSRSFFSNNAQPAENMRPMLPIAFYFQVPIFSSNWFKKKSE